MTAKSPLSLTEEAEKLINDSGFKEIFQVVKEDLAAKLLERKNPRMKYDVQENARMFMDDMSGEDYEPLLPIKTYAYNNGQDYAQILRLGSILLRDFYIHLHKIKD